MTPDKKVEKAPFVPPFVRFVASAIPMVFDDSMSYYECLAALTHYLQHDIVDVINNNATVTEEYIQLTKDLKEYMDNYFENLDVQEEINNKLDDMAEAGTLQEIITAYIQANVAWTFDSVADMKAATNLVAGSYAQTVGYYTPNDDGASLYYITETAPDNAYYETLTGLYAVLVEQPVMNVHQFGAKGDGIADDADALITCFTYAHNIVFGAGKTYLSSKNINVANSGIVDLNGAKIVMHNRLSETTGVVCIFRVTGNYIEIKNGELVGDIDDRETHSQRIYGISLTGNNVNIHHMNIHKFDADGITGNFNNCTISDSELYDCGRNNLSLLKGNNNIFRDLYVHNCRGVQAPGHGICIEPYEDAMPVENLKIYNIVTKGNNSGAGVDVSIYHNGKATIDVHDIKSEDGLYIKLRDDSNGHIRVHDVEISGDLWVQDAVATNMTTNVENVKILNYIPLVTTSFYGAAVKIRAGVNSTATTIKNLHLKNISVEGGEATRGVYIGNDTGGSNKSIEGFKCNISTISPLTGGSSDLTKWKISDIESDYIPDVGSTFNLPRLSTAVNLTANTTIDSNMPYVNKIKAINNNTSDITITSQANNQYGLKSFIVPAKTECYITLNSDGSIIIDAQKFGFNIATNTSYSINVKDASLIYATRTTHFNLYYVNPNALQELAKDASGTGFTMSVTDGVLSVSDASSNGKLYMSR